MTSDRPQADESWDEHYADERDAAFLYRALARVETDPERRALFERLAVVEDQHVARWETLFAEAQRPLPRYATARRRRGAARGDHQRLRGCDGRRALDGIERLPRRQERGGSAGAPDRDGAAR